MNKNGNKTNLMISITQANTEPWLSIWHEGQEKTWMKSTRTLQILLIVNQKHHPNYLQNLTFIMRN